MKAQSSLDIREIRLSTPRTPFQDLKNIRSSKTFKLHQKVPSSTQYATETERPRDRETERQRDLETERPGDREAERQRGLETKRLRDRDTERQRDRETDIVFVVRVVVVVVVGV